MPLQLRTYTLHPDTMHEFVQLFRTQIAPLRQKIGFSIPAAWIIRETNQFFWLMTYDGPEDWAAMDQKYFEAPERARMNPNPTALIAKIEQIFVENVPNP